MARNEASAVPVPATTKQLSYAHAGAAWHNPAQGLGRACRSGDGLLHALGAADQIANVTKNGVVSGTGNGRWPAAYWDRECGGLATVTVAMKCVAKGDIDTDDTGNTGIYTSLAGDIPVVSVEARVQYRSLLSAIGFDATNICLNAKSEAAVTGI